MGKIHTKLLSCHGLESCLAQSDRRLLHLIQICEELSVEEQTFGRRCARLPFAADRSHDFGHDRGSFKVQGEATVLVTGTRLMFGADTVRCCHQRGLGSGF